eukprot:SAG22_NODE_6110_length_897_cov_1.115288_1_plen_39_part_10
MDGMPQDIHKIDAKPEKWGKNRPLYHKRLLRLYPTSIEA